MIVEAEDPKTGQPIRFACAAEREQEIRDLLSFDLSEEALRKRIDRLDISADAKSWLFTLARKTIRVGQAVVQIGRKVLDLVITLLSEFPMTATGTMMGVIFGILLGNVPILGVVLGPILGPLAIAMGFAMGSIQDLSNKALERRIQASVASFDGLKPKDADAQ